MTNTIPDSQNQPSNLKLLRARQRTYSLATQILVLQLALTLAVPLAGAIIAAFKPEAKPYVAGLSLVILLLDILWLDRQQKNLLKRAAKIAEQFDCAVLDIPWNEFVVGERVEAEDIHSAAKKYAGAHDDSKIRDWYPPAAGALPLSMGRIICQRTNLRYDSRLRISYANWIRAGAICIVLGLFLYGLANNLTLTAWVLTLAPAAPVLAWTGREFYRQRDSTEPSEKLLKEARKFWNEALVNACADDICLTKSRELQNAIYARRASSPMIFPLVYRIRRASLEDEMHEGAADFIGQYENSIKKK
jgi:hypothetical protein